MPAVFLLALLSPFCEGFFVVLRQYQLDFNTSGCS